MKLNQQNKVVRFILRVIDVLVANFGHGYFPRRVRWDEEPLQKATEVQKRVGGLFMALWPISLLIFFLNRKFFDSWVDSMIYGRHSIVWFYLAFIGAVCFALLIAFKVAPKIPLYLSIPVAIAAWPIFLWFAWTHLI
jgi:hypothetical protein